MKVLTSTQVSLSWLFMVALPIMNLMNTSTASGSAIAEGECQHYHSGGPSGVHFYTCCNYADPACDNIEFDGASDEDYCQGGQSTEEGGGTHLGMHSHAEIPVTL